MIRRKKEARQVLVVSIFVISIFLTSTPLIYNFNSLLFGPQQEDLDDNKINDLLMSSDTYLDDYYITGSGLDQQVRIFATNDSSSNINNQEYFDVPSMSSIDDTYLVSGDFNFTFQNNFTADHVMEDTYALNASKFIKFNMNKAEGYSNVSVQEQGQSNDLDLGTLTDGNLLTTSFIEAESGIINLTLTADFTGSSFTNTNPDIDIDFDRDLIIGFIVSLNFEISRNATLTMMMKDITSSTWINVSKPIFLDSNLDTHNIQKKIINENLKFINITNRNEVKFHFKRSNTLNYNVTLKELNDVSVYGFDIPITDMNHVALEFDLRGMRSTVNGFYAWIRTLNLTKALNAELNITLYKANKTVARTRTNLRADTMEPDYAERIDSFKLDYDAYHGDSIHYFKFNKVNTLNLGLYNYFIVIKSNSSELIYSLATIPRETFGDPEKRVDHQLKMSDDEGLSWNNAYKMVPGPINPYQSEQLDASPFILNVTRGYMPSDFYISEDNNLKINNNPIENLVINWGIYATSSALTWGLGRWNNDFTPEVSNNTLNNFRINLDWNDDTIKGFQFNVSYSVKAYWKEPAFAFYNVSYNTLPRWDFNFTFDSNHVNFNQWEFYEFWFLYPQYFNATGLIDPGLDDIYNATGKETRFGDYPLDHTIVNSTLATNGVYTLKSISPNIVHNMHSYIDYYGSLLETNGFMYGDNITVRLDIQDQDGKVPKGGIANVSLFYPDNSTIYPGTEQSSTLYTIIDNTKIYSFNNDTILAVNDEVPLNDYYLAFFWSNGTAIGCKTLKIYIDTYDVELDDLFYESPLDVNTLSGIVSNQVYKKYSLLIATVNETTGIKKPDFYPVNHSEIDQEYSITISGNEIPIMLKSFLQNETILNPGETIKFSSEIKNLHELIDLDVSINVKLVALGNENWIIDETTSIVQNLALEGDPSGNDVKEFSVELQIPEFTPDGTWQGKNAPIRKGGAKTIVTIYISDKIAGIYESSDYALLINDPEEIFEGFIIALKYDPGKVSGSIVEAFQREDCLYLPETTEVFINIFDKNLVSSYEQFNKSFNLKMNSEFRDMTINPEEPLRGETFNLTTKLTSEFGSAIENQNVTLQYYDQGTWNNLSIQLTGINGSLLYQIDSLDLNEENMHKFRFKWLGTQFITGKAENFTIEIRRQLNLVSLNIRANEIQIFRNEITTINIRIENTGESTLKIIDISFDLNPNLIHEIVEINNLELIKLLPGHSTTLTLEVEVSNVPEFSVSLSIEAQNILTLENEIFDTSKVFQTYVRPITDLIQESITLITLAAFAVIAILTYIIVKRSIRAIETPIEEPTKKKRRRSRYVPVAEISKETEETKEKDTKTDLDSLLKEEGLKDKEN